MKTFEDNSVDSIVSDPPYGISFMGKKWDYDVPSVEIWKEALRVLKPGGHALIACGTRTQHRMAVNLEDAGFEIRDVISYIYGSGFPKSTNVYKQLKKKCTCGIMEEYERTKEIPKHYLRFMQEANIQTTINLKAEQGEVLQSLLSEQGVEIQQSEPAENVWKGQPSVEGRNNEKENTRKLSGDNVCEMSEGISTDGEKGRIYNATQISNGSTSEQIINDNGGSPSRRPQSEQQQDREPCSFCKQFGTQAMGTLGFGSALKPACEFWTLVRKPLSGTIA